MLPPTPRGNRHCPFPLVSAGRDPTPPFGRPDRHCPSGTRLVTLELEPAVAIFDRHCPPKTTNQQKRRLDTAQPTPCARHCQSVLEGTYPTQAREARRLQRPTQHRQRPSPFAFTTQTMSGSGSRSPDSQDSKPSNARRARQAVITQHFRNLVKDSQRTGATRQCPQHLDEQGSRLKVARGHSKCVINHCWNRRRESHNL